MELSKPDQPTRAGRSAWGPSDSPGTEPTSGNPRRRKGVNEEKGLSDKEREEMRQRIQELLQEVERSNMARKAAEAEMNRRQESYVRRERNYKDKIERMNKEIEDHSSSEKWAKLERAGMQLNGTRKQQIIHLNSEIHRALDGLSPRKGSPPRSARTPRGAPKSQEQQQSTIDVDEETFADRLLEQEVYNHGECQGDQKKMELVDKLAAGNSQLGAQAAMRQSLDEQKRANQELMSAARLSNDMAERLKAQFESQEDDRESLLRQLEAVRAENRRLRDKLENVDRAALAASTSAAAVERDSPRKPGPGDGRSRKNMQESIQDEIVKAKTYEEVVEGLKKLLSLERTRTRQARAAHTAELQQRTNLQAILRQAVEDTRQQRLAAEGAMQSATQPLSKGRRPASAHPTVHRAVPSLTTILPTGATTDDLLDQHSRQELVDQLLAKEEVMKLLFDRTFPGVDTNPKTKEVAVQRISERDEAEETLMTATGHRAAKDAQQRELRATGNTQRNLRGASMRSVAGGQDHRGLVLASNASMGTRASSRPWVFNVDTMISDFMSSQQGGRPTSPTHLPSPIPKGRGF